MLFTTPVGGAGTSDDPFAAAFGATRSPEVRALQNALRALGARVGDRRLLIAADGLVGPKTTGAVNRAFTKHIGPGQAPASYRSGKLTIVDVRRNAAALAGLVTDEVNRRGGAPVVPLKPKKKVPTAPGRRPRLVKSPEGQMLQRALRALGGATGDKALLIAADGIIGPKTTAAANIALSKYVAEAPPRLRGGNLTLAEVIKSAKEITKFIDAQLRKGVAPKPGAQPVKPAPADDKPPRIHPSIRQHVADLQKDLGRLAQVVGDRTLAVKVDGIMGPKTLAALHRAFTTYIRNVPKRLQKLSIHDARSNARTLSSWIDLEIKQRTKTPTPTTPPAPPEEPADAVSPDEPGPQVVEDEEIPRITIPAPVLPGPPKPPPPMAPAPAPTAPTPAQPVPPPAPIVPIRPEPPAPTPTPAPAPAPIPVVEKKKFPWIPVLGGVAVVGGLTAVYFIGRRRTAAAA